MHDKKREAELRDLEQQMAEPGFWDNKEVSQEVVRRYNDLKRSGSSGDTFPAVITIIAGTGGDDAEDFARILADMYRRYAQKQGFSLYEVDRHETPVGGYKNITLAVDDPSAYGLLKHETGVHRLVRISPFNAKKQRHTSFVLVDVTPKVPPIKEVAIPEDDLEVTFMNAGGPGGQNVNKRETAVRVRHVPSGLTVRVERERSQVRNKEAALEILRGKLLMLMQKRQVEQLRDLSFDKKAGIEWGNQVRSYVLHPYKLVKDLRVDYEESNPDDVFEGKIDGFIDALQSGL
ncbi:MAG: PCRF domain-containing protein [Candidatus Kaiserbacteria bacterium]|nr:PCRF domain-containing protein [Candidatus Kaiserbacteria bacterium]